MRNFARLIRMNGGLDKTALCPVVLPLPGDEWLYLDVVGLGPRGDDTRLVSVAYLRDRDGDDPIDDLDTRAEMTFEVGAGTDRKRGWLVGTWRPIRFVGSRPDIVVDFTRTTDGKMRIHRGLWAEWRGAFRRWDREVADLGLFAAFRLELAAERAFHARLRSEHADRSRADLEVERSRARDALGRFARSA